LKPALIAPGLRSRIAPPRDATTPQPTIADLVDITPHVSLLSKVGQAGHSVAEAVAELVDNALDARIPGRPVSVDVSYNAREGWLSVEDDGTGMSRAELSDALVLALSSKSESDIGKFGLGMKTACTSLGPRFVITSACLDAHYAAVAEYDEEQFLMSGHWLLPVRRRKKTFAHGTRIVIESSRLYGTLHQSLIRNLGWTFRHFLMDGSLTARVNGVRIPPGVYEVDEASVMPFEGLVAEKPVRGWAGLLHRSSQRGWYGFELVRQGRIVRRHEKLGFQAHPSTARVVGELHLDDFDTNNLKTDFIRETQDWRELEEWISRTIEPVIAASRKLAHAGMLDLQIRARIEEERHRLLGDASQVVERAGSDGPLRESSSPVDVAVGSLHLEHVFVRAATAEQYAEIERRSRFGEADLIVVKTNLEHPASGVVADRSGWACHNIAEAAALELAPPQQFRELKGVILAKLLSERSLRRALSDSARDARESASAGEAAGAAGV
jgi:histidine kinase/DNA gyrase B/HSP90-like ATPase